jgi:DNA-binding response OmpR family regulator
MDPVNHKVWRGQTEIVLTAKEYTLLAFMVRNANTVLSRANIADNVWEYPFETFTNIIDVYINYLRKKVDGKFPTKLIHTVRGQGYILKEG